MTSTAQQITGSINLDSINCEGRFFSMAADSEKAVAESSDFADDRAILWAAREITQLREAAKKAAL